MNEDTLPDWLINALQNRYKDNPEKIEIWTDILKVCQICEDPIDSPEGSRHRCCSCHKWTCLQHISGCEKVMCDLCLHKCSVCGFHSEVELKICDSHRCNKSICGECLAYSGDARKCSCGDEHPCCKTCWALMPCAGKCENSVAGSCSNNATCLCVICLPIVEKTGRNRTFCKACWSVHQQEKRQFYPKLDQKLKDAGM